jgi:glycosyltransferase involved in cell wall biosynthesis
VNAVASTHAARKRLLFVVTEDWYFVSHRMPIARAARDAGYDILVATRTSGNADLIENEQFTCISLKRMRRSGKSPILEVGSILELVKIYRQYRPSIVHHVALKPVVYGSIAARFAGVAAIVNNVAGLGFVFSSKGVRAKVLRRLLSPLLGYALKQPSTLTIVQNRDDARALAENMGVAADSIRLIKGSGVDLSHFAGPRCEASPPIVLLASRMIREKGISDFVSAATLLKRDNIDARFVLAGAPDPENPHSIPESVLRQYQEAGIVEWWGHRDNIPEMMHQAAIVCLPTTYGEGVPKTLIEAAAGECAIVAYDVPGCREIVIDGENGVLVPPGDVVQLAGAIEALLKNPRRRELMGKKGSELVKREFAQEIVVAQTLAVYSELLKR